MLSVVRVVAGQKFSAFVIGGEVGEEAGPRWGQGTLSFDKIIDWEIQLCPLHQCYWHLMIIDLMSC